MTIPSKLRAPCECRECGKAMSRGDLVIPYREFYDGAWHKSYRCMDCENEISAQEEEDEQREYGYD